MEGNLKLTCTTIPEVTLRSINESDLENLRQWKNRHRESFFFKGIIEPEGQKQWYKGFLGRPDDHMFVVVHNGATAGCIGFRYLEGAVDVYNVILGVPEMGGKGLMTKAMRIMCSYAQKKYGTAVGAKVLKDNPALGWYKKIGFVVTADQGEYEDVAVDWEVLGRCDVDVATAD